MKWMKELNTVIFTALFSLFMGGCVAALPALLAVQAGATAMWVGGSLYSAVESADIKTSISSENEETLRSIKTVAVISSKRVSGQMTGFALTGSPHLSEGMINSINTTLEGEGFKVITTFELEQNLNTNGTEAKVDQFGSEYFPKNALIKSAFELGADAVLVGSGVLASETKSTGFLGAGGASFTTTVKSMNARLISEEGKSLMTLNLTYKKGQQDQEAGKALGLIVAIKVADPSADVKAEVKKRGAEG